MDEVEKLKTLVALYEPFRAIVAALDDAAKSVEIDFAPMDKYENPFSNEYDLRGAVAKIRENLIRFTIRRLMRDYPNITIDEKAVVKNLNEKHGELGFDVECIHAHLRENYLVNADAVSLQEILTKARNRLPVIWENGNRKTLTVADIVHKDKLLLRCWADWSFVDKYGGRPHINYDSIGELAAFEKLVNIMLNGSKPSTARGEFISTIHWRVETKEEALRRHTVNSVIRSVRLFKNGKFEVQFHREEDAVKVARVLLGET